MKTFLTFRRFHLDTLLHNYKWKGKILDIGGKRENKRGRFRPPVERVISWQYVNIDKSTEPDFLCSADAIDIPGDEIDIVLLTEVLEHLEKPSAAIVEAQRVLKPGGQLLLTMPFLCGVHGDPNDFQRWTSNKLILELQNAGFRVDQLESMGSVFAVVYDLLYLALRVDCYPNSKSITNRFTRNFIMPLLRYLVSSLDKKYNNRSQWITTGWYITGTKI
jgi:ubiquinone/menaquinone biosynthesis C-methylase UbiE